MTTGLLLSFPFSDRDGKASDMAEAWAIERELSLRDARWLECGQLDSLTAAERESVLTIPARDAGDICHVCGNLVTWVDHLPPLDHDGAVRCFYNVRGLHTCSPYEHTGAVVDDIFPGV